MWNTYCLQEIGGSRTYVGATLDPARRLQQHNGQLSGGASATHGRQWSRVCVVSGFPTERSALQFEWAWKYSSKKQVGTALQRRVKALLDLLGCEQPTSKATDYMTYVHTLHVNWELDRDPMSFL
jgi:predicted GIY-YIG superfamily endonuclease